MVNYRALVRELSEVMRIDMVSAGFPVNSDIVVYKLAGYGWPSEQHHHVTHVFTPDEFLSLSEDVSRKVIGHITIAYDDNNLILPLTEDGEFLFGKPISDDIQEILRKHGYREGRPIPL